METNIKDFNEDLFVEVDFILESEYIFIFKVLLIWNFYSRKRTIFGFNLWKKSDLIAL